MLKNISNLGTTLSKEQQKTINGGSGPGTCTCQYWDLHSWIACSAAYPVDCEEFVCDPTVECEAED